MLSAFHTENEEEKQTFADLAGVWIEAALTADIIIVPNRPSSIDCPQPQSLKWKRRWQQRQQVSFGARPRKGIKTASAAAGNWEREHGAVTPQRSC